MDKTAISLKVPTETIQDLDRIAHKMKLPRTAVIQLAFNAFIEKNGFPDRTVDQRGVYTVKPDSSSG